MKIGQFEIRKRDFSTGKNRYVLFKDGELYSQTSFGSYEAAVKKFLPYIKNNCLDKTVPDSCNNTNSSEISTNERTVGGYTNDGYLKLMGEEFI